MKLFLILKPPERAQARGRFNKSLLLGTLLYVYPHFKLHLNYFLIIFFHNKKCGCIRLMCYTHNIGLPGWRYVVKNLPANEGDVRDAGLISRSGRSLGEGNSNPLQYYCLRNPMDKGTWWAMVQRVTMSLTGLSIRAWHHIHTCTYIRSD